MTNGLVVTCDDGVSGKDVKKLSYDVESFGYVSIIEHTHLSFFKLLSVSDLGWHGKAVLCTCRIPKTERCYFDE